MKVKRFNLAAALVFAGAVFGIGAAEIPVLKVDFDERVGAVKPVNGVGQPPVLGYTGFGMFRYLKEAGIPYSRLHDVGGAYGKNIFVDVPNLFRNFDADETDPANYDFAFTDLLLANLVENGVEPYFRLGVSIENRADIRAYRVLPPKDSAKWARICEHIIRHYTEGWGAVVYTRGNALSAAPFVVLYATFGLEHGVVIFIASEEVKFLVLHVFAVE